MTDTTITGLRTTQLRVPWVGDPPPNGIMPAQDRLYLMVVIMTKGGLTGMGYLQPLRGGIDTIDTCLKEMIAPMILGRDATEIEGIWQSIWKGTYWMGRMGVTVFAQSAVDIALWDIVGKRAGLPLYRLWGKSRSEVQAYGSGCWRGLGRDGMIAKAKNQKAAEAFVEFLLSEEGQEPLGRLVSMLVVALLMRHRHAMADDHPRVIHALGPRPQGDAGVVEDVKRRQRAVRVAQEARGHLGARPCV